MAYAVVRTDNLDGTDVRAELASAVYMGSDGATPTEIENGNVILLGALMEGEREKHIATDVAADSNIKEVFLVATPEDMYDDTKHGLDKFINEANMPIRCYGLPPRGVFSVTKEALTGAEAPAKGNIVELAAGTKLNVAEAATSGSTQVGIIEDVEIVGRLTFYVIRITE